MRADFTAVQEHVSNNGATTQEADCNSPTKRRTPTEIPWLITIMFAVLSISAPSVTFLRYAQF